MHNDRNLLQIVEALLADPAHATNPLRDALAELDVEFRDLLHQIDRIVHISDRYHRLGRDETHILDQRYQKQLRQLEKMMRISDRYQTVMRELNEALRDASTHDALTGIGNRRLLMERLKVESARAERTQRPLTVALADVDRFKSVNDLHGHEAGDEALTRIAQAIRSTVRDYDICGRWGGEEFMIIMPEVGATEGQLVVERVRGAIAALDVRAGDAPLRLSASFGIAQRKPGESVSDTLRRADDALFRAKRDGRNRFALAE